MSDRLLELMALILGKPRNFFDQRLGKSNKGQLAKKRDNLSLDEFEMLSVLLSVKMCQVDAALFHALMFPVSLLSLVSLRPRELMWCFTHILVNPMQ